MLVRQVWLLAGLMPSLGLAATANLDIWDVDKSCDGKRDFLQESMDVALEIATAGRDSLEFVKNRPDGRSDPDGYAKWKRIYKACNAVLGIKADKDGSSAQIDVAKAVFDKMVSVIPSQQNDPPDGYVSKLKNRDGAKPKLMCGDEEGEDSWKWYGLGDKVPGKANDLLNEPEFRSFILEVEGAWVYDARWVWKETEREKPILCRDDLWAAVYWDKDLLVFCDRMFSSESQGLPSPKSLKTSGITELDKLGDHAKHISVIMVHELSHWFGGIATDANGQQSLEPVVIDQTAVSYKGKGQYKFQYKVNGAIMEFDNEPSAKEAKDNGWERVMTYGVKDVWALAAFSTDKALKNADTLSLFALMMQVHFWPS
ncbi:hypothetical protein FALBO_1887 [Fusarium albosuccineum]|uniref:Lysine-specific metallo-endopeptidase domain-containing protein n=1 Tax=Fusarium albosuccineum TaxID=1237068 RepID=A0A8H4LMD2_9HYPO|nr:hypothetical protein FALBO_1887 [Fusarium albosuccineum]